MIVSNSKEFIPIPKEKKALEQDYSNLTDKEIENYRKSGQVVREVVRYAKSIIKKDIKLLTYATRL
mgnify:CR=1 FL=1